MLLNKELTIKIPDGFRTLDPAERASMHVIEEGEGVVFSNPDRHILLSIGWKQMGKFTGFLLKEDDIAGKMKQTIQKAMKPYQYHSPEDRNTDLDGESAKGVAYQYTAQEVPMFGESLVVKRNRTLYYFNYYTRQAMVEENRETWEGMLQSVQWV